MSNLAQDAPQPEDVAAYLELHGWRRTDGGRTASLWTTEDERVAAEPQLLVPHLKSASDYSDRVDLLIQQLAGVLQESEEKVRQDVILVHFDVAPLSAAKPRSNR